MASTWKSVVSTCWPTPILTFWPIRYAKARLIDSRISPSTPPAILSLPVPGEQPTSRREDADTVVRGGRLDANEGLLVIRQQRPNWKALCLGSSFQRIKLLQFIRSNLLEGRGDCSFFDIDFYTREVLQLLHGLGERLEADRLPRREE